MSPLSMKNKINLIIASTPLILILLMLFNYNYNYNANEIELDDFLNENKINYGSVDNIISERKGLDSTIWKLSLIHI